MVPISDIRFTPVRFREGYDMAQVDELLSTIETLPLYARAERLKAARFMPVRLREGYDMREVDRYLDELADHYSAQARAASTRAHSTPGSHQSEDQIPLVPPATFQAWRAQAEATLAKGALASPEERTLAESLLALCNAYGPLAARLMALEAAGYASPQGA